MAPFNSMGTLATSFRPRAGLLISMNFDAHYIYARIHYFNALGNIAGERAEKTNLVYMIVIP